MENNALQITVSAIEDKLGTDTVILDVHEANPFVDYYVICSARNEANARAIYQEVEDKMKEFGYELTLKDESRGSGWYLLEAAGILTHIFFDGKREYYGLEELWKDLRISGK